MSGLIKFAHGVFAQVINAVIISIVNAHAYHRHSKLKAQLLIALRSYHTEHLESQLPLLLRTANLTFADYYTERVSPPPQVDVSAWFETINQKDAEEVVLCFHYLESYLVSIV